MQAIFDRITHFAGERPHHPALADGGVCLSYQELQEEIGRIAPTLQRQRIGLLLANGCPWAVLDLAAQLQGATCIPMPSFFSDQQLRHLVEDAGLVLIITDQPARVMEIAQVAEATEIAVAGTWLACCLTTPSDTTPTHGQPLPPRTAKITYTSGTTGQPKGVCLTDAAIERVSVALSDAVAAGHADKALTLLPLSTLLANIVGIYAPLYSGSTAYVPDLAECGMSGSTGVRANQLIAALHRYQPTVTVLVPNLLKLLVEAATQGARLPSSLRYIAVGGAPVAPALLQRAHALGLPVYQGYGLSEAASVVSMNTPAQDCIGSVGRPLAHANVRIATDGEVMVSGNLFSGYLGQPGPPPQEWATGDIGFLDDNGYLHISGRKKTAYATAHGRNVAPEWIESALTASPSIAQAALFGEGRDFNVAVVVPINAAAAGRIGTVIEAMNKTLPDYAQVRHWVLAGQAFSARNGLASATGALNREAIALSYADQIEPLYQGEALHAVS